LTDRVKGFFVTGREFRGQGKGYVRRMNHPVELLRVKRGDRRHLGRRHKGVLWQAGKTDQGVFLIRSMSSPDSSK
jgi:hypothetical protein